MTSENDPEPEGAQEPPEGFDPESLPEFEINLDDDAGGSMADGEELQLSLEPDTPAEDPTADGEELQLSLEPDTPAEDPAADGEELQLGFEPHAPAAPPTDLSETRIIPKAPDGTPKLPAKLPKGLLDSDMLIVVTGDSTILPAGRSLLSPDSPTPPTPPEQPAPPTPPEQPAEADAAAWPQAEQDPNDPSTWQQAGYDPNDPSASQQAGYDPNDPSAWQQAGFDPNDPSAWQQAGYDPNDPSAWQQAGYDPNDPSAWQQAGYDPNDPSAWQQAGYDPNDPSAWQQAGYDPNDPSAWQQAGHDPNDPSTWQQAGYDPNDPSAWQQAGYDPNNPSAWPQAGHDPSASSPPGGDTGDSTQTAPESTAPSAEAASESAAPSAEAAPESAAPSAEAAPAAPAEPSVEHTDPGQQQPEQQPAKKKWKKSRLAANPDQMADEVERQSKAVGGESVEDIARNAMLTLRIEEFSHSDVAANQAPEPDEAEPPSPPADEPAAPATVAGLGDDSVEALAATAMAHMVHKSGEFEIAAPPPDEETPSEPRIIKGGPLAGADLYAGPPQGVQEEEALDLEDATEFQNIAAALTPDHQEIEEDKEGEFGSLAATALAAVHGGGGPGTDQDKSGDAAAAEAAADGEEVEEGSEIPAAGISPSEIKLRSRAAISVDKDQVTFLCLAPPSKGENLFKIEHFSSQKLASVGQAKRKPQDFEPEAISALGQIRDGITAKKLPAVVLGLPVSDLATQVSGFPPMPKESYAGVIEREVSQAAMGDMGDTVWDYRSLGTIEARGEERHSFLINTCSDATRKKYLRVLDAHKFTCRKLTSHLTALLEVFLNSPHGRQPGSIALVLLEHSGVTLSITNSGHLAFIRTVQIKTDDEMDQVLAILYQLSLQIKKSLLYYKRQFRGESVKHIYFMSLLADNPFSLDSLSDTFGIPVETLDPVDFFSIDRESFDATGQPAETIAPLLALALSHGIKRDRQLTLLPIPQVLRPIKRWGLAGIAATAAIMMFSLVVMFFGVDSKASPLEYTRGDLSEQYGDKWAKWTKQWSDITKGKKKVEKTIKLLEALRSRQTSPIHEVINELADHLPGNSAVLDMSVGPKGDASSGGGGDSRRGGGGAKGKAAKKDIEWELLMTLNLRSKASGKRAEIENLEALKAFIEEFSKWERLNGKPEYEEGGGGGGTGSKGGGDSGRQINLGGGFDDSKQDLELSMTCPLKPIAPPDTLGDKTSGRPAPKATPTSNATAGRPSGAASKASSGPGKPVSDGGS